MTNPKKIKKRRLLGEGVALEQTAKLLNSLLHLLPV